MEAVKNNVITVLIFMGLVAVVLMMTVTVVLYLPVKLFTR